MIIFIQLPTSYESVIKIFLSNCHPMKLPIIAFITPIPAKVKTAINNNLYDPNPV